MLCHTRHFERNGPGPAHVAERNHCPNRIPISVMDNRYSVFNSKFQAVSSNQRAICTFGRSHRGFISLRDNDYDIGKDRAAHTIDESEHVRNWTSQCLLSKPSAHLFCEYI